VPEKMWPAALATGGPRRDQIKQKLKPLKEIARKAQAGSVRARQVVLYDGRTPLGKIVILGGKRFQAFGPTGSSLGAAAVAATWSTTLRSTKAVEPSWSRSLRFAPLVDLPNSFRLIRLVGTT
jgi:hypothetical protein